MAFADVQDALLEAGSGIDSVSVIGGGAQSVLWGRILASALGRPLVYRRGAAVGPAVGAARLARVGVTGTSAEEACPEPPEERVAEPEPELVAHFAEQRPRFRSLYQRVAGLVSK